MLRNKVEIKYNVTTDFPHLGLHSAAASGNVGLVQYALSHGQPINSVLDGVLPLHAACSGGNDLVVRLLIERGADVNAPRLPRRYSNDRHRDASAPIVGSSGSTPLHFAAANGHTTVVSTLLLHGAHADRPDKHGITPEALARQHGWLECADLLRDWLLNKDKDLKEREVFSVPGSNDLWDGSIRKKLHVKRSVDNALYKLKCESPKLLPPTSPTPSIPGQLDLPENFSGTTNEDSSFLTLEPVSISEIPQSPTPLSHSNSIIIPRPLGSPQRPHSAGTCAETFRSVSPVTRKLGTKYSLLHLFRKAQGPGDEATSPAGADASQYGSVAPESTPQLTLSSSPKQISNIPSPLHHSSSYSLLSRSTHDTSKRRSPEFLSASDMRRPLPHHLRVRSSSGVSTLGEVGDGDHQLPSGSSRTHGRSSSQSQAQNPRPGFRFMRFDSASSSNLTLSATQLQQQNGPSASGGLFERLRPSRSSQSFQRMAALTALPSVQQTSSDHSRIGNRTPGDDEDEEYGVPVEQSHFLSSSAGPRFQGFHPDSLRSVSRSSSSLSQDTVGDNLDVDTSSFIQPSPLQIDQQLLVPLQHTGRPDSRMRGDSISSVSTNESAVPQMTSSSTSTTSKSSANATPGTEEPYATIHTSKSYDSAPPDIGIFDDDHTVLSHRTTLSEKRSHTPGDIDIRSISSHAQAEALVQRAQQSILEMADGFLSDDMTGSGPSTGRTPLSAKLAAYGESLAIQRKLKLEEEQRATTTAQRVEANRNAEALVATRSGEMEASDFGQPRKSVPRLDRQFSLEHKSGVRPRTRIHVPKRPNTSGGIPTNTVAQDSSSRSASIDEPRRHELRDAADRDSLENENESPVDPLPEPSRGSRFRQISSANKLTKMGFGNVDGRLAGGASAGNAPRPGPASGNKVAFGSLKTLMQSLKGR